MINSVGKKRIISSLLLLVFLDACSPVRSHYILVEKNLSEHRYAEADSIIDQNKDGYGSRNEVIYYLDRGMTLHLAGRYEESNKFLAEAEKKIDELYTRSISSAAGAMLSNDNLLPYEGEDFEKVMINIISALNYIYLGQLDETLVEARKVDHKLNLLNDKYEKKNRYKEDALARYLAGILYEAKGELNDAFISYRKAYEAFKSYKANYNTPVPPFMIGDLLRMSDALGLVDEHKEYSAISPGTRWLRYRDLKEKGEIVFMSYNGKAPIKEDYFIDAPIPDGKGGVYLLRVALPKFVERDTQIAFTQVRVDSAEEACRTNLVEDITVIAKKDLEDRIARITGKAIARAAVKYAASRTVKEKVSKENPLLGAIAGTATNIINIATEESDKRSWRTLPAEIQLCRISVNPGRYDIEFNYFSKHGGVVEKGRFPDIDIKAGEKKFIVYKVM